MLVFQYAYFLLLPLLCSERPFLCRKDQIMDIEKLLVQIGNLRKLQDDIAYEITQVVSKANVISEILYSLSYNDDSPVDVSEFLLDNEIYALDNFYLDSYINWESYEDALRDLKYKLECIETIMNNK